ncbi:hypothetical protein cyc_00930 [Cyclospora cayetanensis]|uniref:DUF2059 domain-containing protein n=1 Tax=Cyclospora cayetanensis TaxID=88456 RepID=A0A1D3D4Y3_9EIME|nr:hypothetical protein cyc_00930 [Cyclospora cayetanensis]
MKTAFFAVALGALVAPMAAQEDQAPDISPEDLQASFEKHFSKFDWSQVSPEALGMKLNFDEMSDEELRALAEVFVKPGLIGPEEAQVFIDSLVDPRMRAMLQGLSGKWNEIMEKLIADPQYHDFLRKFAEVDMDALTEAVGIPGGLAGAMASLSETSSDNAAENID